MTDLEDQLTRELAQVAGTGHAPHVDVDGIGRLARRERARSRAVVAGAAAAVLAVVGLGGVAASRVLGPSEADLAADGASATGDPLALPWVSGTGTLHLPDGTVPVGEGVALVHRGGTTLVGRGPGSRGWSLVEGASTTVPRLVRLTSSALGEPVVSTGGRRVAWLEQQAVGLEVHVVDPDSGTATTTGLPAGPDPASARVVDVDDSGRVVVDGLRADPLLLSAGGGPTEVDAGDLLLLPAGRAVLGDGGGRLVALGDDGTTTALGTLTSGPVSSRAAVNPDATAYLTGSGASWDVASIDARGRVEGRGALPLPGGDGQDWVVAGWESTTDVVLRDAGAERVVLVRCTVGADRCERVAADGATPVGLP